MGTTNRGGWARLWKVTSTIYNKCHCTTRSMGNIGAAVVVCWRLMPLRSMKIHCYRRSFLCCNWRTNVHRAQTSILTGWFKFDSKMVWPGSPWRAKRADKRLGGCETPSSLAEKTSRTVTLKKDLAPLSGCSVFVAGTETVLWCPVNLLKTAPGRDAVNAKKETSTSRPRWLLQTVQVNNWLIATFRGPITDSAIFFKLIFLRHVYSYLFSVLFFRAGKSPMQKHFSSTWCWTNDRIN